MKAPKLKIENYTNEYSQLRMRILVNGHEVCDGLYCEYKIKLVKNIIDVLSIDEKVNNDKQKIYSK
jgi:hypothetical protein